MFELAVLIEESRFGQKRTSAKLPSDRSFKRSAVVKEGHPLIVLRPIFQERRAIWQFRRLGPEQSGIRQRDQDDYHTKVNHVSLSLQSVGMPERTRALRFSARTVTRSQ